MAIQLEGLTKRYNGLAVVSRVSLEIRSGEMFVLLGPSGSGKSTLLRMIAGLSEVDEGRVFLDGRDITELAPSRRGIGFVFQSYALFRNMTVADNIEFGLRVHGKPAAERRRRREELLEIVGLSGYGGRRPSQLSGGQQQRVALARALADEPPYLLLDEPFGALDARIRTELRQTLRRIQREVGVTAVFVTHDQEEAFELADRVGVMNVGRLLEIGPPQDLYLHPRSAFVATFLGVSNFLVGETTSTSVRFGDVELPLGTETLTQRQGQRTQVLLRPEDVELAPAADEIRSTPLGQGVVEERSFTGGFERLRVRLAPITGVRQVVPSPRYGQTSLLLEVTRPQPEALSHPLSRGDEVWVGARRGHVLAPSGIDITVAGSGIVRDFAHALAERLWGSVRYPDEAAGTDPARGDVALQADPLSFGFIAVDLERALRLGSAEALEAGHLLIVPERAEIPASVLVCVAVGEPGKMDVRLAERIAWRLGASATVLTVRDGREESVPAHVQRFLDDSARALSARGVPTRTAVRRGDPATEILRELSEGGHGLVMTGAPVPVAGERRPLGRIVSRILRGRPAVPVLVVRGT
jgi:sulfate/thiosulfate transport system ATP-binding protein